MKYLACIVFILYFVGPSFSQQTLRLTDLDISKVRQRSGNPKRILPESGDSLRIGGVLFRNGLKTVAESIFEIDLLGNVSRFHSVVGIGDEAGDKGDVEFQVIADGKMIWSSGILTGSCANKTADLDLSGVQRIVLYVAEAHNWDQLPVYWADAKFTIAGDSSGVKAFVEKEEILTPPAGPKPQINGARVFGVRPNTPFLFTIPATGIRPLEYGAINLPKGLSLDRKTGHITGNLSRKGTWNVTLIAKNQLGIDKRNLRIVCGDKLALTPPMGWNSYNIWGCSHVSDQKIRGIADAFISNGLANYGWTYVNIDCGWASEDVDSLSLEIGPNSMFPDMAGLCNYIHGLGLKAGIYSTPWTHGYDGRKGASADTPRREYLEKNSKGEPSKTIGKYNFEEVDARQYARWGFDYLKYDWTPNDIPATQRMANALKIQHRDMIYSLSNEATLSLGNEYARLSNSWRTTDDINDTWGSMTTIGFNQDKWKPYAGPGHWNDADMLVIGTVGWSGASRPTKLTPNEQYTHISLWSMLASPLILGCDLSHIDDFTLGLITNNEVIDVNQDPLGSPASLIEKNGEKECWVKEMEDGSKIVGLFNRSFFDTEIAISWKTLGIIKSWRIRDLWRQKDLGQSDEKFTTNVPGHGVVLIRLIPNRVEPRI